MSRLITPLALGAVVSAFVLVEPCSAQAVQVTPTDAAAAPAVQVTTVPAAQAAPTVNTPKEPRASRTSHARSDRHNHWHSNDYYSPAAGYYPYSVPYTYGYAGHGGYYPHGGVYSNYGYPINLNSGLERGFRYGNTYINPNFGN